MNSLAEVLEVFTEAVSGKKQDVSHFSLNELRQVLAAAKRVPEVA